jgi:hypothetical protein
MSMFQLGYLIGREENAVPAMPASGQADADRAGFLG